MWEPVPQCATVTANAGTAGQQVAAVAAAVQFPRRTGTPLPPPCGARRCSPAARCCWCRTPPRRQTLPSCCRRRLPRAPQRVQQARRAGSQGPPRRAAQLWPTASPSVARKGRGSTQRQAARSTHRRPRRVRCAHSTGLPRSHGCLACCHAPPPQRAAEAPCMHLRNGLGRPWCRHKDDRQRADRFGRVSHRRLTA